MNNTLYECYNCWRVTDNIMCHKCDNEPKATIEENINILYEELDNKGWTFKEIERMIGYALKEIRYKQLGDQ